MACVLNVQHYPVLIIDVASPIGDNELTTYIQAIDAVTKHALDKGTRQITIATGRGNLNSADRVRLAKAHENMSVAQMRTTVVTLVIARNPVLRGVMTAMRWLMPEKMGNTKAVSSAQMAFDEAMRELQARDMPMPADKEAFKRDLFA